MSMQKLSATKRKQKLAEIYQALNSDPVDIPALRKHAISPGGLIQDEVRRKAWPKLLNVNVFDAVMRPGDLHLHKDYQQVLLDVNRSARRFPKSMPADQREILQNQMLDVIVWVLTEHSELHYYQGYHDICITFLLVCGQKLTYRLINKLSTHHLRDFMDPTMDKTRHILNYLIPIVRKSNGELADYLVRSGVGTIFALSWLITWYGHVLSNSKHTLRLYDFFLASHPLMPIYLAAQIVLHRKEEVLKQECDMALMHHLLSNLPQNLPFEDIIVAAVDLFAQFPPESIAKDAALYYHKSLAITKFRDFELAGYQQRPDFILKERKLRQQNEFRKLLATKSSKITEGNRGNRARRWTIWAISGALGAAAIAMTNVSLEWATEVIGFLP
uniref:TBC1 domain family member 20-like n=1 Tax=Styela clava TaxID=7725 RepID=UPI00193ABB28|nr:TBC1 domain family member 20-like [Styela clava]